MSKPELRLVIYPDPFLRFRSEPFTIEQIETPLVKNTVGAMIKAMYKHYGVGLAAQQVGVPNSVFVMDAFWHQSEKKRPRYFLNPEITNVDGSVAIEVPHPGEGCLSLPYGYRQPVPRYHRVELKWLDLRGNVHQKWFDGYEAIVVQHEMDHLFGHIFPDRLSLLKQDMFKRRVKKVRRQYRKGFKRAQRKMQVLAVAERRRERGRQRGQERLDKLAEKESKTKWAE